MGSNTIAYDADFHGVENEAEYPPRPPAPSHMSLSFTLLPTPSSFLALPHPAPRSLSPRWPRGCYVCDGAKDCTDGFWFNQHASGAAVQGAGAVCSTGVPQGRVVFMGDSDIDYWDTGAAFPGSLNVGVGGYTCR